MIVEAIAQPPFMFYVVWHPSYAKGASIAERLLHHFGADRYRNIVGGSGVTVLFRNANASGSATPLPVAWDDADTTAAVVLIDNALANDPAWTRYIRELVGGAEIKGFDARVFPVAMEAGTLDIDLDVQALRWDRWTGSDDEREQRLLRELTYEFSRMLRHHLGQHTDGDEDHLRRYRQNIQVFLSHSKHDEHGESVARCVRDWFHSNSALSSFLDVFDIPAGLSFSSVMDASIQDGAMVSIYTDSYSSREWCRHEVIEAKRMNVPMLVVDCLQTVDERSFPYLGNVPVIRMDPCSRDRVDQVASLLLDEVFKDFLWRQRVERFHRSHPQVMFTARPPELISLSVLTDNDDDGEQSIVYPGPPLGLQEARLFADIVPNVRLHTLVDWLVED